MTDLNSTPDRFPEFVAANYRYGEVTEHYEGDRVAAAEEVRSDVEKLLQPFRDGGVSESVIQAALMDFVKAHPVGEDLDEQLGALGIGMEREIAERLTDTLCKDLGAEFAALIKTDLNTEDIWRDPGDIAQYLVKLIELVKKTQAELNLDAGASLLAAKDLSCGSESDIAKVKDFFESSRFLEQGISRSDFVRQVLGDEDRPASLLEAIYSEDDNEDEADYFDDEYDEDEGDFELFDGTPILSLGPRW